MLKHPVYPLTNYSWFMCTISNLLPANTLVPQVMAESRASISMSTSVYSRLPSRRSSRSSSSLLLWQTKVWCFGEIRIVSTCRKENLSYAFLTYLRGKFNSANDLPKFFSQFQPSLEVLLALDWLRKKKFSITDSNCREAQDKVLSNWLTVPLINLLMSSRPVNFMIPSPAKSIAFLSSPESRTV